MATEPVEHDTVTVCLTCGLPDSLREAVIRAVAATDGYANPDTEPGGWWDRRCAPVLAVVIAHMEDARA